MRKSIKKYRLLLLTEALCLAAALALCFEKEQLVYEQPVNAIRVQTDKEIGASYFDSEKIVLYPGVYQVRYAARVPEGGTVVFEVSAEKIFFNSLKTNSLTLTEGAQAGEFELYVSAVIENAFVRCHLMQTETTAIKEIKMYRTGIGGRILFACVLAGSILLNGLILFREQILAGKVTKKQQAVFWSLVCSVLLAYFPYCVSYIPEGERTRHYLEQIEEKSMESGLFVPIWLRSLGFPLMTSYKIFVFFLILALALAVYCICKKIAKSSFGALLGSMSAILLPGQLHRLYETEALWQYLAAGLLCSLAAFAAAWLERRLQPTELFRGVFVFFMILLIGLAVWKVNEIAYLKAPVRLYTAEHISEYTGLTQHVSVKPVEKI